MCKIAGSAIGTRTRRSHTLVVNASVYPVQQVMRNFILRQTT